MLTAAFVINGAVAACLLVGRLLLRCDERLYRGNAGWSVSDPNRTEPSTPPAGKKPCHRCR